SRRRHTRCYRDWSSDVCSSDLDPMVLPMIPSTNSTAHSKKFCSLDGFVMEFFLVADIARINTTIVVTTIMSIADKSKLKPKSSKIGRASCREREKNTDNDSHIK